MKVQYTGNGYTLNNNDNYEVLDTSPIGYKIRNDNGHLTWYSKTNFVEVKDKVSVSISATNTISSDLVNKIEKELKDTEQRMADLRKQLEDAKLPPTNNILLRQTRKNPYWKEDIDFENALARFAEALADAVPSLTKGMYVGITDNGDGIILDGDYKWKIENRLCGDRTMCERQVLVILDK
jgi:hypothetical protein